jgi:hypothetical protein
MKLCFICHNHVQVRAITLDVKAAPIAVPILVRAGQQPDEADMLVIKVSGKKVVPFTLQMQNVLLATMLDETAIWAGVGYGRIISVEEGVVNTNGTGSVIVTLVLLKDSSQPSLSEALIQNPQALGNLQLKLAQSGLYIVITVLAIQQDIPHEAWQDQGRPMNMTANPKQPLVLPPSLSAVAEAASFSSGSPGRVSAGGIIGIGAACTLVAFGLVLSGYLLAIRQHKQAAQMPTQPGKPLRKSSRHLAACGLPESPCQRPRALSETNLVHKSASSMVSNVSATSKSSVSLSRLKSATSLPSCLSKAKVGPGKSPLQGTSPQIPTPTSADAFLWMFGEKSGDDSGEDPSFPRLVRTATPGVADDFFLEDIMGPVERSNNSKHYEKLQHWDIDPEDIDICMKEDGSPHTLGQGSFGVVCAP